MSVPGALTGSQMDALLVLIASAEMASSAIKEDQQSGYDDGYYLDPNHWLEERLDDDIETVRREFGLNQPEQPE